jgi:hypothetical protein
MSNFEWILITLAASWLVGVISFVLWLTLKVIPKIHNDLDAMGMKEETKRQILTKVAYPPRFFK